MPTTTYYLAEKEYIGFLELLIDCGIDDEVDAVLSIVDVEVEGVKEGLAEGLVGQPDDGSRYAEEQGEEAHAQYGL
jgi:hypothetical protein